MQRFCLDFASVVSDSCESADPREPNTFESKARDAKIPLLEAAMFKTKKQKNKTIKNNSKQLNQKFFINKKGTEWIHKQP